MRLRMSRGVANVSESMSSEAIAYTCFVSGTRLYRNCIVVDYCKIAGPHVGTSRYHGSATSGIKGQAGVHNKYIANP